MLELSWGGTRNVELNGGIRRRFLKNGDTVIMEGWCEGRGGGRERSGTGGIWRVLGYDPAGRFVSVRLLHGEGEGGAIAATEVHPIQTLRRPPDLIVRVEGAHCPVHKGHTL